MFAYYACWIKNFSTKIIIETFPPTNKVVYTSKTLCNNLCSAYLHCINNEELFAVECNASHLAVGANQNGHPVTFMLNILLKANDTIQLLKKRLLQSIKVV